MAMGGEPGSRPKRAGGASGVVRVATVTAALAVTAGACTFASNLDALDDRVCGAGFKACSEKCHSLSDPNFGCSLPGCAPCFVANGAANCSARTSVCAIADCAPGFSDCNGRYEDGCETATSSDPSHCGACDLACTVPVPNGAPGCASGHCVVGSCNVGWRDCDGLAADGCETVCGPRESCALVDGGADGSASWTCR
jgi:hypothetical protein